MNQTLLIIDDNESVRQSLQFLFERRGYQVVVAEGGPEGIAAAKAHEVHGAIVDYNMPGMNGIIVCRELLEVAASIGRRIPVWMMTGACTPEISKGAREAGALDVFAKPFDFKELFRQFDEVIGPVSVPKRPSDVLDQL